METEVPGVTGARLEQEQEEEKIARTFFQKIRSMKKERVKEKISSKNIFPD